MNSDLIAVLDHMEREKGIPRKVLIEAIQASLLSASKKSIGPARELEVTIDPKTGDIKAFSKLIVVERVADPYGEISLENARKITSKAALGDEVTKEVTPKNFGRIAAQTGKQVVIQKIREAEKISYSVSTRDGSESLSAGSSGITTSRMSSLIWGGLKGLCPPGTVPS